MWGPNREIEPIRTRIVQPGPDACGGCAARRRRPIGGGSSSHIGRSVALGRPARDTRSVTDAMKKKVRERQERFEQARAAGQERLETVKAAAGERVEAAKASAGERVEAAKASAAELQARVKPKLRGVIHEYAFPVSLLAGLLLVLFVANSGTRADRFRRLRALALGPARNERALPPGQLAPAVDPPLDAAPRPLDDLPADRGHRHPLPGPDARRPFRRRDPDRRLARRDRRRRSSRPPGWTRRSGSPRSSTSPSG